MIVSLLTALISATLPVTARPAGEQQQWTFRVLLDGREIGEHRFTLTNEGVNQQLRSEAAFAVRLLFIDAWRYHHRADETWQGNCLRSLVARTTTNGTVERVQADSRDGGLVVDRSSERRLLDGCVQSFAYWNPSILDAQALLNSQTGELQPVRIVPLGTENLTVRGSPTSTRRYRISAPAMQIDLWYAGDQWVGLESLVKGERRLRYELS
jgi:hypothetical protein